MNRLRISYTPENVALLVLVEVSGPLGLAAVADSVEARHFCVSWKKLQRMFEV